MISDHPAAKEHEGTVLVAEDDPDVRALIETVLDANGYRSISATEGNEALKLFLEPNHAFSVVLTDLQLPGLNGLQLLREIRKKDPNIAVVIASGRIEDGTVDELKALDVTAFLDKPFTITQLLSTMTLVSSRREVLSLQGELRGVQRSL